MKELLLGASLLSALVMAPIGVNLQDSPSVATPNAIYDNYTAYDDEYITDDDYPDEYGYEYGYENENEYESDEPEFPLLFRTTARLNLRTGPGTHYDRTLTSHIGQLVYVTDLRCGEWFAVEINGMAGYMYSEFLVEVVDIDVVIAEINGDVERLHWSYARQLTTPGTPLTIIDVRTGITWQVASFSNGNHSDVEPITAADTEAMRRAFGGRWCWTPRPVHVIVGDRILAASINGMPHAGSTNHNNNMNGHVCLHFYGSSTHNGNRRHTQDHQNAVNEAFRASR